MMDRRIGAQLYNVRAYTQDFESLEKTFERIHNMGYKTAQVSGVGSAITAEQIAELSKRYDIEIVCTHRDFDDYAFNLEREIEFHKTIGCKLPGFGIMGSAFTRTEAGFREFAYAAQRVINEMKKYDLPLLYHNHSFEFEKASDGRTFFQILVDETELDFVLDVYWAINAGLNPAKLIRELGPRAKVIHFKDMCVKNNEVMMSPVMEGNLDWDDIIAACDEAGSLWAAVEHDVIKDGMCPFESMEISYNNLKTKGFN